MALPFDGDGFIDLSQFGDGDPDVVLDDGSLGVMNDAISADQQTDAEVDMSVIEHTFDGVNEVDLDDLIPVGFDPGEVAASESGGPFDLSGYDVSSSGDEGSWIAEHASDGSDVETDDVAMGDDTDLDTYDEGMDSSLDEFADDFSGIDVVQVDTDAPWAESLDEPIEADMFEGIKDDEWGNG